MTVKIQNHLIPTKVVDKLMSFLDEDDQESFAEAISIVATSKFSMIADQPTALMHSGREFTMEAVDIESELNLRDFLVELQGSRSLHGGITAIAITFENLKGRICTNS